MKLLKNKDDIAPIHWIKDFLSDNEIDKIFKLSKNFISKPAHVFDKNFDPSDIRRSSIKWIYDDPSTDWLYEKIVDGIKFVNQNNFDYILKFVEDLQFTSYDEKIKGFYGKHIDCDMSKLSECYVNVRKLSFSIQLSDESDYDGGELIMYLNDEKFISPKKRGTIIFFDSKLSHEVTPVIRGKRHSLVGWANGPNLR